MCYRFHASKASVSKMIKKQERNEENALCHSHTNTVIAQQDWPVNQSHQINQLIDICNMPETEKNMSVEYIEISQNEDSLQNNSCPYPSGKVR